MFGAWVCFTSSIGLTTNAKEGSVLFFDENECIIKNQSKG